MQTLLRICFFISLFIGTYYTGMAQAPVANFTVSPDSGCAPLLVTFVSTSTGNPTSFEWDFGNSFTSTNPHTAAHTYTTPGTYTVKLKVSNANGTNTKTITQAVTVLPSPTVNFTGAPLSGCPPLTVNFTDNSVLNYPGPATYTWNFGTGIPSNQQNPSHIFSSPSLYNVTLTVKNGAGCTGSSLKQQYIEVFTPPVADFTFPPICTSPGTTTFTSTVTAGTGPYTYSWDYGDNTPSGTTANPSHTYTNSGNYQVTLVVTDANGCKDTVVKTLNVGTLNASFTAPSGVICIGSPVHFLNTSTSAAFYMWDFGDNTSSNNTHPTHVYSGPGTFRVKLLATDFASVCTDTFSLLITVSQGPTAAFNITPSIPCPASDTLFFTNLSTGAVSYEWNFGDGSPINTQTNPYHVYNFDSVYLIKLKATDANGCSQATFMIDTFYKTDLVTKTVPANYERCVPATIQFKDSLTHQYYSSGIFPPAFTFPSWRFYPGNAILPLLPVSIVAATWDFGDGSPIVTTFNPSHTYTQPGNYKVIHTVVTNTGCTLVDTLDIFTGVKPNAAFTVSDDSLCVDDMTTFLNQSTNGKNYYWYIYTGPNDWQFDQHTTHLAPNKNVIFNFPGIFNVTLVADSNGCTDTFTLNQAVTVFIPKAVILSEVDCDTPTLVRFRDTSVGPINSRVWNFGDGNTDTAKNPIHQYSSLGNYTVTLTVTNDTTGCSHTESQIIQLYVPTADFVASDTAICVGDSISLTPTFSSIVTYADFPPYIPEPSRGLYVFPHAGLYTVKLVFRDVHGCLHDTTKQDYILVADPNPNYYALPNIGCSPLSAIFVENSVNTPGAYTTNWTWTFGDNTTASTTNDSITHLYGPGKYTVKLVLTDNVGCKDSLTFPDYIQSRNTVANFRVNDSTVCIGDTVKFTNTSSTATNTPLTYKWNFGDGSPIDTATNPSHIYTQTGNYTVTLIAVDNIGCADTLVKPAHIKLTKPNASFTMDDTFAMCPPLIVQFTNNTSGAQSYQWSFGDGSTSRVTNPSNIYINPGKYGITLIAIDAYGCTDTAYGSSEVLGYAGGLTYNTKRGCNPLTVTFTANLTNVTNFLWDFSDGVVIPATGTTITHTYKSPGKFLPKIIFTDSNGCVNSSTGLDTIYVDDVITDFVTTPICINTPVTFKDTSFSFFSQVNGWSWNINNGQVTSGTNTATAIFPNVGTYPVVLIVKNANGCRDTLNETITVLPLPTITATGDSIICVGDAASIAAFGGVSYEWTPSSTVACPTCQSTSASPNTATNYVVTGTDANGCKNKDTVKIITQSKTTSDVGLGGEICADSSIQLQAFGAQQYVWTPSSGLDDPNIPNPIASPNVTTTYTVIAYEGSCQPDSNTVRVIVHPLPTVRATGAATIVVGNSVNLNAAGTGINSYLWSPSESLDCITCSSPIAKPTATTTYVITVTSDFGCIARDNVTITVLCDQSQLFIPNTFSPNGDGENDVFYPRGIGLKNIRSFRIYNRWGEMVYERQGIPLNDVATAWDGTYKGAVLNPDVFVYVLEGICDGGEVMIWKGDITLIR